MKQLPLPPSATPWKAGEVVPGISLRVTKGNLECRAGSEEWSRVYSYYGEMPFAVRPIAGDRYYLFAQQGSRRMHANFDVGATVMNGCVPDKAVPAGSGPTDPTGWSPTESTGESTGAAPRPR